MVVFDYVITDDLGIHARPAGVLIREVKKFKSSVIFSHGSKKALGTKLFEILRLGIKQGNTLGVMVDGIDEQEAATAIKQLLQSVNL